VLVGDRQRDRAGARADVEDGRPVDIAQELEAAVDDNLGLGPRDEDALAVARANAERTGLAERVTFLRRDLHDGLEGRFDLVVSNPPYVGEEHTEAIAAAAAGVLVPGGRLVVEVADGRAAQVCAVLRRLGYEDVRSGRDLTGRDRVVEGRWSSAR